MPQTPPPNADPAQADQPPLSIQEQIDQLLMQIETEEPGTIAAEHLPASMREQAAEAAEEESGEEGVADAMAAFEQALEEPAEADEPEPAQAPAASNPQQDMLAALNAALQDMKPKPAEPAAAEQQAPAQSAPPAERSGTEPSTEELLQAEINALLNSVPGNDPAPEASQAPAAAAPPAEPTREDKIADEIESLLSASQQPAGAEEPSIDALDQMLANEIDADDELLGDFHSVQDVTAGIQTGEYDTEPSDDEHAATARDVADELDTQPQLQPAGQGEDALAAILEIASTAQENEAKHQAQAAAEQAGWAGRIARTRVRLLHLCFHLNYPARRYLSLENRANLGYIAILNLFGAAAIWFYLIFL